MSKASKSALQALHGTVAEHLATRIEDGETTVDKKGNVIHTKCAPSVLSTAIKFLSDNGVKVDDTPMNDGSEIAAKIRKLAEEDEESTYGLN